MQVIPVMAKNLYLLRMQNRMYQARSGRTQFTPHIRVAQRKIRLYREYHELPSFGYSAANASSYNADLTMRVQLHPMPVEHEFAGFL